VLSALAVATTGALVFVGVLGTIPGPAGAGGQAGASGHPVRTVSSDPRDERTGRPGRFKRTGLTQRTGLNAADLRDRDEQVSRSDRRGTTGAGAGKDVKDTKDAKDTALGIAERRAATQTQDLAESHPREIGRALLAEYGFSAEQFSCLDALYVSESDWRINADNPTSSAYGIPQALTALHDLPADYMTSAESQIRWGLGYIQDSYGTPCSAWGFKQGNGWY